MPTPTEAEAQDSAYRAKLGTRIIYWSLWALGLFGVLTLAGAGLSQIMGGPNDALEKAAQLLFSSVLPLLGTWVGTVLAFYYSKENFQAATQGTIDVMNSVSQRLSSTKVSEKMMPRTSIVGINVPASGLDDVKLSDIAAKFATAGGNGATISRLFLFDANGAVALGILHRSTWNEMLVGGLGATPKVDVAADTLKKLLDSKNPGGTTYRAYLATTLAYVASDRSLADAKAAMEAVSGCQDVVITQTGRAAEPAQGWISNVDIARLSQA